MVFVVVEDILAVRKIIVKTVKNYGYAGGDLVIFKSIAALRSCSYSNGGGTRASAPRPPPQKANRPQRRLSC